jgi:glycosyltransferase involved in cell wall biosynthesis
VRLLFVTSWESRLRFRASGGMERCFWNLLDQMSRRHHVEAVCRDLSDAPRHIQVRALGPVGGTIVVSHENASAEYVSRVADEAAQFDAVIAFNAPEVMAHIDCPAACIFCNSGEYSNTPQPRAGHKFVFPAQWLKDDFLSTTLVEAETCFVVPMGVAVDRFMLPAHKLMRHEGPIVMLFASIWHDEKGIEEFLETCTLLSAESVPFRATLVGSTLLWDFGDRQELLQPRSERERIEHLVFETAGKVPELSVIGEMPHEQMPSIYQNADLLISPSRCRDCFPLVALESMSCGTPVLAPRSGGYVELIQHGETGYLLGSPSGRNLADTVTKIIATGGIDGIMKRAARNAVLRLSWEQVAARIENILLPES